MTIDVWLKCATEDAERRGIPELKPILEALAKAKTTLRAADFNDNASRDHRRTSTEPRVPSTER